MDVAERAVTSTEFERRIPGRPRSDAKRKAILVAANQLLEERGIAALTIDAVAERAGVAKATIYRWWPSKGPLAIEGFLTQTRRKIAYPDNDSALSSIKTQVRRAVRAFASKPGRVISGLIAQSQSDPETRKALLSGFFMPRRLEARELFRQAVNDGELRADLDIEAAIDALYGPLYYRLLIGHGPLDKDWAECVVDCVMNGIQTDHTPRMRGRNAGNSKRMRARHGGGWTKSQMGAK